MTSAWLIACVWLLTRRWLPSRELRTLQQVLQERPWTTEPHLRRLVKEKRIPFFKAGGKVLFDLAEIDAFAERGRVEPPAPLRLVDSRGRRRAVK